MKNPPQGPLQSTPDGLGPPDEAKILSLLSRIAANKKAKSDRYGAGSRKRIPQMPERIWRSEWDVTVLMSKLLMMQAAFSRRELVVLTLVALFQTGSTDLSITDVARRTKQSSSRSRVGRTIHALAACGVLVNLGDDRNLRLAVNPVIGLWDLARLAKTREKRGKVGS